MAEKKEFSVWDPAIAVPFIKSNEGCRLASYRDPAGVWTVGYGSTRLASGNPVIRNIKITQEEADELLESELYRLRDVPICQGRGNARAVHRFVGFCIQLWRWGTPQIYSPQTF